MLAILYFTTKVSRVFLFWAAFILTRPLGATVGDFLDKPVAKGGLELSRPLASAVLAVVILVLILILPQRAGRPSRPGGSRRVKLRSVARRVRCSPARPLRAVAGPPYLTDDPVPTDLGHWEIYAFSARRRARARPFDADAGLDLNYGAVKDVQLTATLPSACRMNRSDGWRTGTGDVELARQIPLHER